jgi:hypothetical protein
MLQMRRGGDLECKITIKSKSYYQNAMSPLRNAVIFKLVKMWRQSVSSAGSRKLAQYFLKDATIISALQATNILSNEPQRVEKRYRAYTVRVERTEVTCKAPPFTNGTKVVAWKAKC